MKKLIIKLTLIAIIVVACNTAMAVFPDGPLLQVLMHCDETNQAAWLTTPDDNSRGRLTNECILDMDIQWTGTNTLTEPTLMPDSPKGGSYFSFDGTNDSICVNPGWLGGDSLLCDLSSKRIVLRQRVSTTYSQVVMIHGFVFSRCSSVSLMYLLCYRCRS